MPAMPSVVGVLLALLLAVTSTFAQDTSSRATVSPAAPGYWFDSWRGWHFYEEAGPEPEVDRIKPNPAPPPTFESPQVREIVEFERLQKALEEYRKIAIMSPTEANVRRYMELEVRIVSQASRFADVAQRVAWVSPELDTSLHGRPVNAKALEVFEQEQLTTRALSIAALGKDHVLFFFFRSDCPYCHAFAPTLAAFQARYGINVVPVSIDGGAIPGFPNPRRDNGIARTLNVTQVPAVFLAQPFTGKISPIGFGVLSESQLLERIAIVSTVSPEAAVPAAGGRAVP